MTVDEVERVMGRYMKGAGSAWALPPGPAPAVLAPDGDRTDIEDWRARGRAAQEAYVPPQYPGGDERGHATGTMIYRWNDLDAAYNADRGIVTFADGRVTDVDFVPD